MGNFNLIYFNLVKKIISIKFEREICSETLCVLYREVFLVERGAPRGRLLRLLCPLEATDLVHDQDLLQRDGDGRILVFVLVESQPLPDGL